MGFFSFCDAATGESIMNCHTSEVKEVYFLQPDGASNLKEDFYDGYGVFAGIDVYEWLATMNLPESLINEAKKNTDGVRGLGTSLAFNGVTDENGQPYEIRYPIKLSFDPKARYEDLPASNNCPRQGFFGC